MANTPIGSSLDLAVIRSVSRTQVACDWLSRTGEKRFNCPLPQPYPGHGGGILVGIEVGTVVLVGISSAERKFIVATVPMRRNYFSQEGLEGSPGSGTPFPQLLEGEIKLKSSASGSYINIHPQGAITLDAGLGDSEADLELSPSHKAMFIRVDNRYNFTEAGRSIEGVIKRDKHQEEKEGRTNTFDFLAGEGYNHLLTDIGRSPKDEVQYNTKTYTRPFIRNPALIEKRNIIYEYANSFDVNDMTAETDAMKEIKTSDTVQFNFSFGERNERRTDILNLSMLNYNHLMERVEGTLVDIYGNVLDINRNVIDIPSGESKDKEKERLDDLYRHLRRSVKYHFEINSRKDIADDEPSRKAKISTDEDTRKTEQREHSRWSVDVDAEGLTKINIPSSSNTGNIPVLSRYLTSRAKTDPDNSDSTEDKDRRNDGSFRDKASKDIRVSAFSTKGPKILDSAYKPEAFDNSAVTAGTAYHDLLTIASVLFNNGKWGKQANGTANATDRISPSINNKFDDTDANAGGRSIHANLDGSVEISVGADSIDSKSLLLDLEGGVISHYGVDTNGRSIIHQSDGTVLIQIGGKDSDGPGRLEIHLVNGSKSSSIIMDEGGMTIDVQGNLVIGASGTVGISAGANMTLNAGIISCYGTVDHSPTGARTVSPGGTTITPSGMAHIGMFG